MAMQLLAQLPAEGRFAAARAYASKRMSYFTSGLYLLVPQSCDGLGTLAISESAIILYDTKTLGEWTAAQAGGVVLHEYLHIYLKHSARFRALVNAGTLQDNPADRDLWNLAADAEINQNLLDAGVQLPAGITPEVLGLPPHQLAEVYVRALKQRPPTPSNGKACTGKCGSGAGGNTLEQEPPKGSPEGRSTTEIEIQRAIDSANIAGHRAGRIPAGLAMQAASDHKVSEVPWTTKLSNIVRAAVTFRQGQADYTWTTRSRYQSGIDGFFGARSPILPGMHSPIAEVAMAIDTSGSMDGARLDKAVGEAAAILQAVSGARVTFFACDARVNALQRVRSVSEIKRNLVGGGGTDFRPVFDSMHKCKPRPDILIFLTDGAGRYPDHAPAKLRTIWGIIETGHTPPWGDTIQIKGAYT